MVILTSSSRAAAASRSASGSSTRTERLYRWPPALVLVAATIFFLLTLLGAPCLGGVVIAYADTSVKERATQGDVAGVKSADYVFASLEELNKYMHGVPYNFRGVRPVTGGGGEEASQIDNGKANVTAIAAELDDREIAEVLELYTTTTSEVFPALDTTAATSNLNSKLPRTESSSAASPLLRYGHLQNDTGTDINVTTASMCATDFTCPRSSVAWASGSFTGPGMLTLHTLSLPVGLQLKLSLCCHYRFDGTLLRDRELYDAFLQELLHASPFHALHAAEKRALFPHDRLYIVDTWDRKRVYNTSYTLTEEDVANGNDGDGDVLVLTTGVLTPAGLLQTLSSSPVLADATSGLTTVDSAENNALEESAERNMAAVTETVLRELPRADMQLRITNRVLKCKCPHILTVMPLLHVRRDALPPVTIVGLGSHCGVQPRLNLSSSGAGEAGWSSSFHRIRRVRRRDGSEGFATSFELLQRLPPTTLVSWTVRQIEDKSAESSLRDGSAAIYSAQQLLRHTRLLPTIVNGSGGVQYSIAASPYFVVEPNVRYEVSVTVSRGPRALHTKLVNVDDLEKQDGAAFTDSFTPESLRSASSFRDYGNLLITRSARGRFVLRLPLNRSWALPPVQPAPHFGFRRWMRLTNATLHHAEVAAALNPYWHPSQPLSTSALVDGTMAAGAGGSGGWFGLGSSTGGSNRVIAPRVNRTLSYYGYWENAPLKDQLLPQAHVRVSSNPFTDLSPVGVSMPLFIGRNLVAYMVRDVDDVCDPVVLEGREVWAVQSILQTSGPVTACGEQTEVAALVLRGLYKRMRSEAQLAVTVPNTTWAIDRLRQEEVASEGSYNCVPLDGKSSSNGATSVPSSCVPIPDTSRDGSECYAAMRMTQRGVYDVVWTARVAVREPSLVAPENIDPLYAVVRWLENANGTRSITSTTSDENPKIIVEVRSDPLLVVRRQASYPAVVKVELPMHARRWVVSAPRVLTPSSLSSTKLTGSSISGNKRATTGQGHDVLLGNAPTGYWRSRPPIRVLSVDERLTAELDTNDVPNVHQTLPNGTLEFVAQDSGELLSLTARVRGSTQVFAYTSKCPDTLISYELHVVAFAPPPIVPAYAPIYTEEGCVVLVPPREVRKDEIAEWHIPPCAAAAAAADGRSPYLVERVLTVEEQEEHAYVTTAGDGGEALLSETQSLDVAAQNKTAVVGDPPVVTRRAVTALMACGVEVYQRCDVVWSVRNLVAEVHKTYSLRRCQRPPEVLFHEDGRQLPVAYPQSGVFQLPSMTETVYVQANTSTSLDSSSPRDLNKDSVAAPRAMATMHRQRRQRQIIPIAGYHSSLGYSFNYTGAQDHFEMHLYPLSNAVAHQLVNTRHDYVEAEAGAMVLRRRTLTDIDFREQDRHQQQFVESWETTGVARDAYNNDNYDKGNKIDSFWTAYEANTPSTVTSSRDASEGAYATSTAASISLVEQERLARLSAQQRSQQLDQTLEEMYIFRHESHARRLRVAEVGNASLFPVDYVVRSSSAAVLRSRGAADDQREFARRGMCVERPGAFAVLAVSPRGSVKEDERYGTVLPAPPAPAVAVLPFCAPHYTFARYPELATVYGYEYTWTCPEEKVITVTKYNPTYSVLSHTPELSRAYAGPGDGKEAGLGAGFANGTLCELAVVNHLTKTEQRDWFLVRRVYPSPLPVSSLVVLSENAANSLQIVSTTRGSPLSRQQRGTQVQRTLTKGRNDATINVVSMAELYSAPAGTYPFTKARRVVGKSVILHIDAPSEPSKARWAVESVVPTTTTSVGTQVLMSAVEFKNLYRHPVALARGRGGSTVLVKGLRRPGLYTLTHTLPDPANPFVCPPVTLTEMLDVFHARVLDKELFVCGDTATLQAVPIPREIAHEFVGQWEVLSLATDEKTVWTAGVNFTGIRFEHGTRAETLVHGLPFGVVTMRWAIYRLLPVDANDINVGNMNRWDPSQDSSFTGRSNGRQAEQQQQQQQRVLVDYDTVEVFVLTENLPSRRLVTLADQATILTTSSAQSWKLEEVVSGLGDETTTASKAAAAGFAGVRMQHSSITNSSHSTVNLFTDALSHDATGRAIFHTYYGLRPRPGSSALLLQHLPVGTVHLRYDVVPSQNIWGKMVGHSCALQGHYEVERVSAYLTASTSLDHECDGYTGQGRITLCLHTEGSAVVQQQQTIRTRNNARVDAQRKSLFWQSQVRLADPATLEDTIKRGAREIEQLSRGRCATPWWVAPSTQWYKPTYTSPTSLSSSPPTTAKESKSMTLPGRCVSFTVKAGRHLSPREVAQPLFVAVPRAAGVTTGAAPIGESSISSRDESLSGACPFHGDFISTRVIDGTPLVEGGSVLKTTYSSSGGASGALSSSFVSSGSFFGLSQLFQLGLPHMSQQHGSGEDGNSWGIRFLPVLQLSTLRRSNATMRPMIGLRGVLDDVTTELNVSGVGTLFHGDFERNAKENTGAAATVLLRLDLTNTKHLGGYIVFDSKDEISAENTTTPTLINAAEPPLTIPHHSLLHKCVEGTVQGADVLQYWSETNRPDGRVDHTAQEWLDYVYAVRDAPVVCDVLFASLDHLVSNANEASYSVPQRSSGSGKDDSMFSSSRGWYSRRSRQSIFFSSPPQQQQQRQQQSSSLQYVSLTEMEQQVESIRKQYRWTADGIDVTGLSPDLQNALSHRRVTTTQLKAIEAARRDRQAAEEAQQQLEQQRQRQRELENAPSQMSPMERLTAALRAYQGVAHGGEVAVLRIQLPLHSSFVVPYDVFLRTALHKDVLCGTSVEPPPPLTSPNTQPLVRNPYSLVPLGRVQIRDVVPSLRVYPPVVKQCEVEGGLPTLTFELTGANFVSQVDYTAAEEVELEEIPNPDLVKAGYDDHPGVGLTACVAEMRRGLNAVVEAASHKRLYLQLNSCPFFEMLTPEEYNEYQDSEAVLRRLQFSRYLRVTVRQAIRPDSFLANRKATSTTARKDVGHFDRNRIPLQNLSAIGTVVTPTTTDASFIVEVRPTLARLHLRSGALMQLPPDAQSIVASAAGRYGSGENRQGGGGGSLWSRSIDQSDETSNKATERDSQTTSTLTAASHPASVLSFIPTPARPLVLCEADLRRYGFQLGIELIGDTWTAPVGEDGVASSSMNTGSGNSNGRRAALPRQRTPPNVALINSFSVVEHHSLDSSHHLYMKDGGFYRSYFINYLFSTLLSDPTLLQTHSFIRRYNDTFASIVVPPLSAVGSRRSGRSGVSLTDGFEEEEEDADLYAVQQQQHPHQRRYSAARDNTYTGTTTAAGGHTPSGAPIDVVFPAVRQFCKVEEIMFAVPGIATECRGCLLADTTFFVAGDLTGVWSPSNVPVNPSSRSAPESATTSASGWSSETFTRPLVVPWYSVSSIPQEWRFEWICPAAAHRALERLALQMSSGSSAPVALSVMMDVVLYRVHGRNGETLPAQQRPTVLLSSQPLALTTVLEQNRAFTGQVSSSLSSRSLEQNLMAAPLHLRVEENVVGEAYTQLAEDVLRHRRHARTTMEYHRDDRDANGLLVVNASIFLKVCSGRLGCTVVSITDSLLTVEPPKVAERATSRLRRLLEMGKSSSDRRTTKQGPASSRKSSLFSPIVLLHHGFMSFLCLELLKLLMIARNDRRHHRGGGHGGPLASIDAFMADPHHVRLFYTAGFFSLFFLSYATIRVMWTALCLLIWSLSLYFSPRPELTFLFVASVVYSHYLM